MRTGEKDEFKSRLKQWLKSRGVDYLWLAEQCGVSENTVRNWMAKAPIPPLKKKLLSKLLSQLPGTQLVNAADQGYVEVEPSVSLSIRMSPEVYNRLVRVAFERGTDVAPMINSAIMELAKEIPDQAQSAAPLLMRNRKVVLPVDSGDEPTQE